MVGSVEPVPKISWKFLQCSEEQNVTNTFKYVLQNMRLQRCEVSQVNRVNTFLG